MSETVLKLNYGGFPPFSARGCIQTLAPLKTGEFRRTVNGELVYTGLQTPPKYRSIIQGQDKVPPALDGLWRGISMTVECLQMLCQEIRGTGQIDEIILEKQPVPESIQAEDAHKELLLFQEVQGQHLKLREPLREGLSGFIYYRPILEMRLIDFSLKTDEWGTSLSWSLHLEEI